MLLVQQLAEALEVGQLWQLLELAGGQEEALSAPGLGEAWPPQLVVEEGAGSALE